MTIEETYGSSLREFQDYVEDARRANQQTFEDALGRVLSVVASATTLGGIISANLQDVDFDSWYAELARHVEGMGGHATLVWPHEVGARVSLQLELLRRVDNHRIDLYDFSLTFLGTDGRYDEMIHAFSEQVVRPFARDLVRILHTAAERHSLKQERRTLEELPKRPELEKTVEELQTRELVALIFLDLDNFKAVNDTNGHRAGNECLEKSVILMSEAIERKGILYRYGGDEFAVVLPNFDPNEAVATAERLRRSIYDNNPGGDVQVSASIGVAVGRSSTTARELLDQADEAMYRSKKSGKNAVSLWDAHPASEPRAESSTDRGELTSGDNQIKQQLLSLVRQTRLTTHEFPRDLSKAEKIRSVVLWSDSDASLIRELASRLGTDAANIAAEAHRHLSVIAAMARTVQDSNRERGFKWSHFDWGRWLSALDAAERTLTSLATTIDSNWAQLV